MRYILLESKNIINFLLTGVSLLADSYSVDSGQ